MTENAVILEPQPFVWSAGAPCPVLLSSEQRTFVIFDHPEGDITAIEFIGCTSVVSGFPNDEVLHGHRLAERGLSPYQVHEVIESSWLAELRAVEHHHSRSPEVPFPNSRNYILTFHDSMIEAIARELTIVGSFNSPSEALTSLASQLES